MSNVTTFVNAFTDCGEREHIISFFKTRGSYWFAAILFKRFLKDGAAILYDPHAQHFGTGVAGKVFDISGDVTKKYQWVAWLDYPANENKQAVTREKVLFTSDGGKNGI